MSINVSVGFQIPTNVVEVGNEISTQQLGAITSGSSPTSANPFTTVSYVSGLYATKASPTFTGTVTIPAGASISGYLTTSSASSTYQTIAGMSSYVTPSYLTSNGYLTDAPADGSEYVRKNAAWAVATGGGGGGISDAPSDGSYYARYNASWISFTIPTVPPASVTNIDLTGNFNGYSMGSGYYSFKYDSTANTMRIQDGFGSGTTVSVKGIEEPVTDISIGQTLDATHSRILNVLSTYTISIPSDSTYSFPIGTRFFICSPSGATVDAMMTSASINGVVGGNYTLPNGVSTLIKVAADTWYIS
jgi:hypothetical protein